MCVVSVLRLTHSATEALRAKLHLRLRGVAGLPTTRMAQDDAGPVSDIRNIRADSERGRLPRQRAAISGMASSRRSGQAPSTSQAPAAYRGGTGTHPRTSDGERLRTVQSK